MGLPDPGWIVVVDRWRVVVLGALLVCTLSLVVSFFLPERYQVVTSIQSLTPDYASDLRLPPNKVHITTLQTLALSPSVLDTLLQKIRVQKELVGLVSQRLLSDSKGEPSDVWERISTMSAQEAATLLGAELTEDFASAWENLPSSSLLPGYLDFKEKTLAEMGALRLTERLSASTYSSLETNITTQYQPILNLAAEWDTRETAAIVAYVWAKTTVNFYNATYLVPTENLQLGKKASAARFENGLAELSRRKARVKSEASFSGNLSERNALLAQLFGVSEQEISSATEPPPAESERDRESLVRLLIESEVRAASLEEEISQLEETVGRLEANGVWVGDIEDPDLAQRPDIAGMLRTEGTTEEKSHGRRSLEAVLAIKQRLASVETRLAASPGKVPETGLQEINPNPEVAEILAERDALEEVLSYQRGLYEACRKRLAQARTEYREAQARFRNLRTSMETSLVEAKRLNRSVLTTQARLTQIDVEGRTQLAAYQRFLDQGGTEALVSSYPEILGLRVSAIPMLPKKPYRPRPWLICSMAGVIAVFVLSAGVVVAERFSKAHEIR